MSKFAAINSKPAKQGKPATMAPLHNSLSHAHTPGTVPMFNQRKVDEEIARASQQILSIQTEQTGTVDENIATLQNCNTSILRRWFVRSNIIFYYLGLVDNVYTLGILSNYLESQTKPL